jgi:hypothetical protein
MLEFSVLPPDNPQREEFVDSLASEGDWALREWEALLSENEALSIGLLDIQVPQDLAAGLMKIPSAGYAPWLGRLVSSPALRMAATVLLVLAFGGSMFYLRDFAGSNPEEPSQLQRVAELALDSYVHDHDISVITLNPDYMQRYLAGSVPFEIKVPASLQSDDMRLIGGKSASLGTYPAVYTRWSHQMQHKQSNCAIIQFRSQDFGLPETTSKEVVHSSDVNCPSALGKNCNVVVWTEGGDGYALVADSACAMHYLGSR